MLIILDVVNKLDALMVELMSHDICKSIIHKFKAI